MRVIVLGGAGDVGSRAVEELAVADDVTLVTVADRDLDGARRVVERARACGGKAQVRPAGVDATDLEAVVRAMEGHDVAASALGPFYRFEAPMVAASIQAGVDYTSVCDDFDPETLQEHTDFVNYWATLHGGRDR